MLKVPCFDMNIRPETFVPLVHCVIVVTLSQAMPDLRQTLLWFIEVMNLMSVARAYDPPKKVEATPPRGVNFLPSPPFPRTFLSPPLPPLRSIGPLKSSYGVWGSAVSSPSGV